MSMHRSLRWAAVFSMGFVLAAIGFFGCGVAHLDIGSNCPPGTSIYCCPCPVPEACVDEKRNYIPKNIPWECPNACDGPTPPPRCFDGGGDAAMNSLCVAGSCVAPGPAAWKDVSFWSDWQSEPPPCPEDAPVLLFEGFPAPPALTCPTCACAEPEGSCSFPETWTVDSQACPGGGVKTNFAPASGWDGTCTEDKAIPPLMMCGGVPCVKSITVSQPVIKEEPCEPYVDGLPELPPTKAWSGVGMSDVAGGGPEMPVGKVCASVGPPPSCAEKPCSPSTPGFKGCISRAGEHACPVGWDERHVLYKGTKDERRCSECTCDEPSGGFCKIQYGIFSEPMCTTIASIELVSTAMDPPCRDFMGGTALASKSAEIVEYTKGTCTPGGGDVEGELVLGEAMTVCCAEPTM